MLRFQLMADQLPRSAGRRPGRGDSEAGLTALAFATDHPDRFLLGSEGGGIFLCSLASEVPISSALGEREQGLLNPVTSTFEPHQGQVIMLQASTFHRNIFASAGSDNEVRLWNTLQVRRPAALAWCFGFTSSDVALAYFLQAGTQGKGQL